MRLRFRMPRSWFRVAGMGLVGVGWAWGAQAADLTVSAASSLTQAFRELAQAYERSYPEDKVKLNFGASGVLLQQIGRGAPVDVFASADQETMDQAVHQGSVVASSRRDFARNTLVVVVPTGPQPMVSTLAQLTGIEVRRVALGQPSSVPAGRYGRRALQAAGVWEAVAPKVIYTQSVRQALDYVARGEVEAGFVYATDAAQVPHKVRVAFEMPLDVPIRYSMARTTQARSGEAAWRFVAYVWSPSGQAILARHGFLKP
jgi:molybdate transport system substrate-binding protein